MKTQNRTTMDANLEYDDTAPGVSEDEQRSGLGRALQIAAGVLLVAAGILMLLLPGQGLLTILVGLNLIKPDNLIVRWLRRRIPGIPEEGEIPRKYLIFGGIFFAVTLALSIIYGDAAVSWVRNQF